MKIKILLIVLVTYARFSYGQNDIRSYLEMNCPDSIPEIFLPGIVSGKHHEHSSPTFDFSNNLIYWTTVIDSTKRHTIMQTEYKNGEFSTPTVAPFSGKFKDFTFILSEETNFLCSKRPRHDNSEEMVGIWTIHKNGSIWSEPEPFHFKNDSSSYGYRLSSYSSKKSRLYFGTMYSDNINGAYNTRYK